MGNEKELRLFYILFKVTMLETIYISYYGEMLYATVFHPYVIL